MHRHQLCECFSVVIIVTESVLNTSRISEEQFSVRNPCPFKNSVAHTNTYTDIFCEHNTVIVAV